ncbi:MAG: SDR family oxidoreductase, partial [Gemmatimonadaceae bacterium]
MTASSSASEGSSRTAVVTGASRGIGLAVAAGLVSRNFRVAMLARSAAVLSTQAAALGGRARPVAVDLTIDDDVQRALADVESWLGLPDVLVNSVGVFGLAPVGSMRAVEFAATLDSNLVAPYRLLHAYVPRMRERGSGHIVSLGSVADRVAYPGNAAYAASKFGVRGVHE